MPNWSRRLPPWLFAHPWRAVLIAALVFRLAAVVFSQGYIHSDDQFDTVDVSYDWLRHGLWNDDGELRWKDQSAAQVGRFPLYTLSLYAVMAGCHAVGITALGEMMYLIRFLHALLSLLPVWAVFRIIRRTTGRDDWAFFGGMAAALHFALPFLGVRNLIEMIGGELWIVAVYFLYRYREDRAARWLYWAGCFTGMAWMIRFQLAFAALPIPLLLWYEYRRWRPALQYTASVALMIILSGVVDYLFVGRFGASTINNLGINTTLGPRYNTIPFLYPVVLLILFIPPLSVVAGALALRRSFWRRHLTVAGSTAFFIVAHMVHANQQERFMIPIIPVGLLLAVLALWERYRDCGYILKSTRVFSAMIIAAVGVNLLLLFPCTVAFGHKGLVQPMEWLERMTPRPRVMIIQPDMSGWLPADYAGFQPLKRKCVRFWIEIDNLSPKEQRKDAFAYFILYPQRESDRQAYLDSIQVRYGPMTLVRRFEASYYDALFHRLNPHHYGRYEAWVYRREDGNSQ